MPDVPSIEYQEVDLDGRLYGVIVLPRSPHVHVLGRNLETKGGARQTALFLAVTCIPSDGKAFRNHRRLLSPENPVWPGETEKAVRTMMPPFDESTLRLAAHDHHEVGVVSRFRADPFVGNDQR